MSSDKYVVEGTPAAKTVVDKGDRNKRLMLAGGMSVLPFLIIVGTIAHATDYCRPLVQNPVGLTLTIAVLVWLCAGVAISLATPFRLWKAIILPCVFIAPLALLAFLGPAILTIINAIGPLTK